MDLKMKRSMLLSMIVLGLSVGGGDLYSIEF